MEKASERDGIKNGRERERGGRQAGRQTDRQTGRQPVGSGRHRETERERGREMTDILVDTCQGLKQIEKNREIERKKYSGVSGQKNQNFKLKV